MNSLTADEVNRKRTGRGCALIFFFVVDIDSTQYHRVVQTHGKDTLGNYGKGKK
jgi:hypothetical protein